MKNITETISHYLNAWNEKTPEVIKATFMKCCSPQITYTDKNTRSYTYEGVPVIKGIDGLTALVMGSHANVPGRIFSVLTEIQHFDGHLHYSWGLKIPGHDELAGWDYMTYNEDGLIEQIVGFLPVQP